MSSVLVDGDKIITITLNSPDTHNAFDADMMHLLTQAFEGVKATPSARAVVLRGTGPSFCAGANLSWMKESFAADDDLSDDMGPLSKMMLALDDVCVPVISLVHGNVMGGGLGLVALSDIVIADANSVFCLSEVKLGLIPAVISPYVIRAIGHKAASKLFITAERFSAQQAKEYGFVSVLDNSLNACEDVLKQTLKLILKGAPQAQKEAKQLVRHFSYPTISNQTVKDMDVLINKIRSSEEAQMGIKAFFDKCPPPWQT